MEEILALKSAYLIIAERNNDVEWKKKAEIMEYLSELTKNEMLYIFNVGCFNNIVLGYVFTALKQKKHITIFSSITDFKGQKQKQGKVHFCFCKLPKYGKSGTLFPYLELARLHLEAEVGSIPHPLRKDFLWEK